VLGEVNVSGDHSVVSTEEVVVALGQDLVADVKHGLKGLVLERDEGFIGKIFKQTACR